MTTQNFEGLLSVYNKYNLTINQLHNDIITYNKIKQENKTLEQWYDKISRWLQDSWNDISNDKAKEEIKQAYLDMTLG